MRDMLNEKNSEIEYLNSILLEKDEIIIHLESEKELLQSKKRKFSEFQQLRESNGTFENQAVS